MPGGQQGGRAQPQQRRGQVPGRGGGHDAGTRGVPRGHGKAGRVRCTRTPSSRWPAASATSAWPPSWAMVTTVRDSGQARRHPTRISAATAVPRISSRGGSGSAVTASCHSWLSEVACTPPSCQADRAGRPREAGNSGHPEQIPRLGGQSPGRGARRRAGLSGGNWPGSAGEAAGQRLAAEPPRRGLSSGTGGRSGHLIGGQGEAQHVEVGHDPVRVRSTSGSPRCRARGASAARPGPG